MLITNGRIYTMEGRSIESGWVRIENGLIVSCGVTGSEPAFDGDKLDAGGGFVLPGLIDAHSHLGMWEDAMGFEGADGNEETDPLTPELRAIDAINPMDRCFSDALKAGVTTVMTGPGSANPVGGQFVAIKTAGRRVDDMIVKFPAAMKFAMGENPKTVYHEKNRAPVTRMAVASIIREALFKTREYIEKQERAKKDPEKTPDFNFKYEALAPLLRGEMTAHFHAHRADDILTAIRIAKEFNLQYVIVHATEGHLIADILVKENTRVITGPSLSERSKPELKNLTFETPGLVSKLGLMTAICTDHPVIPLSYLMLCAALACKEGMDENLALSAVTLSAARIAGIDERVGSLKAGKDADIVIYDRHPFELLSRVKTVVISGERAY